MDIVKNNKIIARYMGGKFSGESRFSIEPQDVLLPKFGVCRWDTVDVGEGKTLQYHKSWDWLIPVIDKITSDDTYPKYRDHSSSIVDDGGIDINTKFISNTYNQVIYFIHWYNEQLTLSGVEQASEFEKDLFKLINKYCSDGLKKPDLVKKMEWVLGNCKMS
tara:strand:- start:1360 stop:1845 length:486 start_codon:yes stop_codon:yes gene_type:complete